MMQTLLLRNYQTLIVHIILNSVLEIDSSSLLNYIEENRDDYKFFYKDGYVYIVRISNYMKPKFVDFKIEIFTNSDNTHSIMIDIDCFYYLEDNLKKHN